jgi:hypothetical protein
MGRIKESLAMRDHLQAIEPSIINYTADTAEIYWLAGDTEKAVTVLQSFRPGRTLELALVEASAGHYREAAAALREMPATNYPAGMLEGAAKTLESAPAEAAAPAALPRLGNMSFAYMHVGAPERVLEFYEDEIKAGYFQPISTTWFWHPTYAAVRKTERFPYCGTLLAFVHAGQHFEQLVARRNSWSPGVRRTRHKNSELFQRLQARDAGDAERQKSFRGQDEAPCAVARIRPWRTRWGPRVRQSFFECLDGLGVLFVGLRTGAHMREPQILKRTIDGVVRHREPKVLVQPHDQIAGPPPHHAVDRRNGAFLHDPTQKSPVRCIELGRYSRRRNVDKTIRSLVIEPDHPVPQRLPIHPADLGCLAA